ncbi:MAG: ribonuclease HII [Prevotellaceae bacterium]|jgi:ribonuclease HII|nr:ribonuclease HII [Prevotellaceae bacterium]
MKIVKLAPYLQKNRIEAGCDEAGRGCLAGPVVAAAVILPPDFHHPLLNDSKQMTRKHRDKLRTVIEAEALAWQVAKVSHEEIDAINILRASIAGMHRALDGLLLRPDCILVDGNKFFPYRKIPHVCVVKGDATFASIAAASVLAKTHRDEWMCRLAKEFPAYGWEQNMGYPTEKHRMAIQRYGVTPYHRRSFKLVEDVQVMLF